MNWIHNMCSDIALMKLQPHLPGDNELSIQDMKMLK